MANFSLEMLQDVAEDLKSLYSHSAEGQELNPKFILKGDHYKTKASYEVGDKFQQIFINGICSLILLSKNKSRVFSESSIFTEVFCYKKVRKMLKETGNVDKIVELENIFSNSLNNVTWMWEPILKSKPETIKVRLDFINLLILIKS